MNLLSNLLPKKAPKLAELAECENRNAYAGAPIHLRVIGDSELHKSGGLRSRDLVAACGREMDWDIMDLSRERVIAALPNQHESFRYCVRCLEALGITSD